MALIPLIAGGVQLGSSLYDYYQSSKNRTPRFENTALGQYYTRVSREGAISPSARRNLLGTFGAEAGTVAANRKANIRGRLASMGLENSIAGVSALDSPGAELQTQIGNESQRISLLNEQSKEDALRALAEGKTASREQRRFEGNTARTNLLGGISSAAGQFATAGQEYIDRKKLTELTGDENAYDIIRLGMDQPWTQKYRLGEAQAALYGSQGEYYSGRIPSSTKDYSSITNKELLSLTPGQLGEFLKTYGIPVDIFKMMYWNALKEEENGQ